MTRRLLNLRLLPLFLTLSLPRGHLVSASTSYRCICDKCGRELKGSGSEPSMLDISFAINDEVAAEMGESRVESENGKKLYVTQFRSLLLVKKRRVSGQ